MSGRSDAASCVVRPPRAGDAEGLGAVHHRVWRETYREVMRPEAWAALSREQFVRRWTGWLPHLDAEGRGPRGQRALVALSGERVVGFAMTGPARDAQAPARQQLWSINILAEHHGTGLADRLLAECLGEGPAYLWVADGNSRAVRFYERHGFALDGTSQLDEDGITELRMVRPAEPPPRT